MPRPAPGTHMNNKSAFLKREYALLLAGTACLFESLTVLFGWGVHNHHLVTILRDHAPMPYNAAVAMGLVGAGLLALGSHKKWIPVFLALPVALLALLTLAEYLFPIHISIDQVLFHAAFGYGDLPAGRIALLSAVGMLLLATALASPLLGQAGRTVRASLGAVVLALAIAAVLGIWARTWTLLSEVSLPAALLMAVAGAGLLIEGRATLTRWRLGSAFLTALTLLTLTLVFWRALVNYQRMQLRTQTAAAATASEEQLAVHLYGLHAIGRAAERWSRFGPPTAAEWQLEAHMILRDHPQLGVLDWAGPDGHLRMTFPMAGRADLMGRSLIRQHPRRAIALELARQTGALTMSPLVSLFRGGHGFIAFAPVRYHQRLQGYMIAVLRPQQWLPPVFHHVAVGYSIEVVIAHHVIYERGTGVQTFKQRRSLSVLGQEFIVTVAPTPQTLRTVLDDLPFLLLGAGLFLTALAALLAWSRTTARGQARQLTLLNETLEQRVGERTLSLAHELAERRQTEEALAEERERLRVTLLSIGDGIIATDAHGRITLINRAAEALTGWMSAQAIGQPIGAVFHLRDEQERRPLDGPVEQALRLGTEQSLERPALLQARDGIERPIADSAAPIRDQTQRIVGAVLVFRDVSEHRALQEEALKSRGLESLGILAGGIAHDFNNILTALIGNLTLAATRPLDAEVRSALTDAERAAWRARELTQQLLTFARGGAPVRRRGSVTDTIRDVCPFFLKGSHVQCRIELPDQLWPVEFDPDQLGQVLHNLALNALEAMPDSGVFRVQGCNRRLESGDIAGLKAGAYVELRFSDTGPGIPKTQLSRIFDPYFSTKSSGTGLGLSIVHSIIKRHHGAALADSPSEGGALFRIYLPAVDNNAATTVAGDAAVPRLETLAAAPNRGAHILVMDDDDAVRKVARGLLQALGYRVTDTTRGEEAVERYQHAWHTADAFSAVLLDLTIPGGMGGLDCLRALQQIDPAVRGIVSTGYHQDPVIAQYADFGFCAAVAKPFRLEDLAGAIGIAVQTGTPSHAHA